MYRVSARGGLRGAGGEADAPGPIGHRKARCNSHPTSDMMLALRKYGVTSRRNFTVIRKKRVDYNGIFFTLRYVYVS